MTGGAGADLLAFRNGFGNDCVTEFANDGVEIRMRAISPDLIVLLT